ncbi:MAG TPA: aerial mycelium formation protein [Actinomycetota bacterium]|nr:aerial mycelium formation protein [Actinomycetota bacterium]
MAKGNRRSDRILDPSYLDGVENLDEEHVRTLREECEQEENVLSYERRLLHARLDIIRAEIERRASGGSPKSLIDRLPEILTGGEQPTHRGSFPKFDPPDVFDPPRRRIEKLVTDDTLARLPDLSDEEIQTILADLEGIEGEISESRRAVLTVLDRLTEELGRRLAPRT